jgi:hypothetical protein
MNFEQNISALEFGEIKEMLRTKEGRNFKLYKMFLLSHTNTIKYHSKE